MPTDAQIIDVLRNRQPCPTYYVKNVLRDIDKGLTTSMVRRRLLKMEKSGVVGRHPRYGTPHNICWIAVESNTTTTGATTK